MQTSQHILKCVSFVGIKTGNAFIPKATCFYVHTINKGFSFYYIVTAEHVVRRAYELGEEIYIRNNRIGGGFSDCKVGIESWYFHPDSAVEANDIAIARSLFGEDDILTIALAGFQEMVASQDEIAKSEISIGDEVVVAGLFGSHCGADRNIPISRIGNIASLDCGKVEVNYSGLMEAYLIEIRSLGGISGSPVFVNMGERRRIASKMVNYYGPSQRLLGFVHGHFNLPHKKVAATIDDNHSINVGIAVVIPIFKVLEVINSGPQVEWRDSRASKWKEEGFENSTELVGAINSGRFTVNQMFGNIVCFSSIFPIEDNP